MAETQARWFRGLRASGFEQPFAAESFHTLRRCGRGQRQRETTPPSEGRLSACFRAPACLRLFVLQEGVGRLKAEAAAEALVQVRPSMEVQGHVLEVPMPGKGKKKTVLGRKENSSLDSCAERPSFLPESFSF